tara:strand:- start:7308 stop:7604 length:297 start_codon:yes stop_codon:yes gene_type:complete
MHALGVVKGGDRYPHKVPTANIDMMEPRVPEGVYRGMAVLRGDEIGDCFGWVLPHRPDVLEAYVAGWDDDMYGEILMIKDMIPLGRDELKQLYDRALK